jgi:hypothetical protein
MEEPVFASRPSLGVVDTDGTHDRQLLCLVTVVTVDASKLDTAGQDAAGQAAP